VPAPKTSKRARNTIERRYDLEAGDHDWLKELGGGKCWICEQPETIEGRSLAVDHDHDTGAVRGLLCTRCNWTLGRCEDDPKLLRAMADYLERALADFSDACHECMGQLNAPDRWIVPPLGIVSTNAKRTTFGYRCDNGHEWTCNWQTSGTPISWSI
jgi:hypothetical protein